jgi:hypothetical protein
MPTGATSMDDRTTRGPAPAAPSDQDIERTLRGVSDQFFLAMQALAQLERRKRAAPPSSERFVGLSREVTAAAQEVLRIATDQQRLAEQVGASGRQDGLDAIEAVRPTETLAAILAEWRAIERELAAAPADTPEAAALSERYAALRARYASALARVRTSGDGRDGG